MIGIRIVLCICCLSGVVSLTAQDKLLFMNGRELPCTITGDTANVIRVSFEKKSGKVVNKEFLKSELFSYTPAGKAEVVLYARDEAFGNIYSVDEMRVYMAGERDASENFTAVPTFIVGIVACGAVSYLGEGGVLTAIGPPLIYTGIQFIPKIKIRAKTMSDEGYKYNDVYADGYEPPARSRKAMAGLSGGAIGAAAGALVYMIAH
ncbi:MAG: hypothetical protein JNM00_09660 [Flavobacteriales bacterium]|nr:hypothetical protein [Flavobacteriales bacterium]